MKKDMSHFPVSRYFSDRNGFIYKMSELIFLSRQIFQNNLPEISDDQDRKFLCQIQK
jgi:hypothetical protein